MIVSPTVLCLNRVNRRPVHLDGGEDHRTVAEGRRDIYPDYKARYPCKWLVHSAAIRIANHDVRRGHCHWSAQMQIDTPHGY